jgi:uncharacterized membrane protein YfcA
VVVPVLYHVLALIGVDESLRMHLAIGTSLAAIVPVSMTSLAGANEDVAVDRDLLRRWSVALLAGVAIGCVVVSLSSGRTLALSFAFMALFVALYFAFGGTRRIAELLPEGIGGIALPAAIGGVSTMMGVGGATLGVPALTLYGMPAPRAIATASALGALIAVPGTIAAIVTGWHVPGLPPYSFGFVNVLGVLLIAPATFLMAPAGRALAHMTDAGRLRILFALFIVLMTGRMLYDALG